MSKCMPSSSEEAADTKFIVTADVKHSAKLQRKDLKLLIKLLQGPVYQYSARSFKIITCGWFI